MHQLIDKANLGFVKIWQYENQTVLLSFDNHFSLQKLDKEHYTFFDERKVVEMR